MIIWILITTVVTFVYAAIILFIHYGWKKTIEYQKDAQLPSELKLSVVIAIRNEEENVKNLIDSLLNQTLEPSKFEVILVDDQSTDSTFEVLISLTRNQQNFKVLRSENGIGKKQAIINGINHSAGHLIVSTDADCEPQPKWLDQICNYYIQYKPRMIIGPVLMKHTKWHEKIQALDFFSLMISGAGACGINKPIMCNGANLAYEKDLIHEFDNPFIAEHASGDDVFLLLNIKNKYPGKVHFLKSKEAVVYTNPEKDILSFFKQRYRWASKSKAYRDIDIIITAISVFLVNTLLFANLLQSVYHLNFLILFGFQLLIKMMVDYIILSKTLAYFNQTKLIKYFLISWFFTFFYIPAAVLVGISGKVMWKGRKL